MPAERNLTIFNLELHVTGNNLKSDLATVAAKVFYLMAGALSPGGRGPWPLCCKKLSDPRKFGKIREDERFI